MALEKILGLFRFSPKRKDAASEPTGSRMASKRLKNTVELFKRPKNEADNAGSGRIAFFVFFWMGLSALAYIGLRLVAATFPGTQGAEGEVRLSLVWILQSILWDRTVISESFWDYDSSPLSVTLTILACQTSLLVGVVFAGNAGDNLGRRASSFYNAVSLIQIIALVLAILTPAFLIDSASWAIQRGGSGVEMVVSLIAGVLVVCMGVLVGDPDLVLGFKEAHLHRRLKRCKNVDSLLKQDRDRFKTYNPRNWALRAPILAVWALSAAVALWGSYSHEQVDVKYSFWIFLTLVVTWTTMTYATLVYMPFWDAAANYWGAKLVRFSMGMSVVLIAAILVGFVYPNWFMISGAILLGAIVIFSLSKLIDIDVRSCSRVQRRWSTENLRRLRRIRMELKDASESR